MNIKLDLLRSFITVAECGNLQEASEILSRTPSAISMSLKQLNESLGAELFETDRKSSLTPIGRFVLQEGRRALADFDESMYTIQRYAHGEMGVVKISTVPSVATRLLPDVVREFRKTAPNVRLELRDTDSEMVAAAVRNGSAECGIASLPLASNDLTCELLLEEPFGLVCRPDHPLAKTTMPLTWQSLEGISFISNGLLAQIRDNDFNRINSDTTIQVHNISTLLSFIQQDMGVTLLPRLAVPEQKDFVFLSLADKTAVRQLYFLQQRHHRLSPAALAFKTLIQKKATA
jgi:DNA-binding transcriptional LysR family regulator